VTTTTMAYNGIVATRYRAGWIGLFSGENQHRAVQRVLADINGRGLRCAGLVQDQWNFFVRLWWLLIAIITLGFFVRVPNVLIVTEPMAGASPPETRYPPS
jgi:hypothetical protein